MRFGIGAAVGEQHRGVGGEAVLAPGWSYWAWPCCRRRRGRWRWACRARSVRARFLGSGRVLRLSQSSPLAMAREHRARGLRRRWRGRHRRTRPGGEVSAGVVPAVALPVGPTGAGAVGDAAGAFRVSDGGGGRRPSRRGQRPAIQPAPAPTRCAHRAMANLLPQPGTERRR